MVNNCYSKYDKKGLMRALSQILLLMKILLISYDYSSYRQLRSNNIICVHVHTNQGFRISQLSMKYSYLFNCLNSLIPQTPHHSVLWCRYPSFRRNGIRSHRRFRISEEHWQLLISWYQPGPQSYWQPICLHSPSILQRYG